MGEMEMDKKAGRKRESKENEGEAKKKRWQRL
jgi:hypothetical protein